MQPNLGGSTVSLSQNSICMSHLKLYQKGKIYMYIYFTVYFELKYRTDSTYNGLSVKWFSILNNSL